MLAADSLIKKTRLLKGNPVRLGSVAALGCFAPSSLPVKYELISGRHISLVTRELLRQ
jgi:hypothetical protein